MIGIDVTPKIHVLIYLFDFYHVLIHINISVVYTNSSCFIDTSGLVFRQSASFHMV